MQEALPRRVGTEAADAADAAETAPPRLPLRWVPTSLRSRIVAWFIGVLAIATVGSVLVTYEVLLLRLDQRIDSDLRQEGAELRRLATGRDPRTGEPFGTDVRRIFDVYLARNVPSRNEALLTFVDGAPYRRSQAVTAHRLDTDRELTSRWVALEQPSRDSIDTPEGKVEYLALPIRVGDETVGVFVAAVFRDLAKDEADSVVLASGAVGLAVLLLGSLIAWRVADRIVRPVSALTQTARSITESDLSKRIPVQGRDEVAQLAGTFNAMLDRLERAFRTQRQFAHDAGHELKTPLTIVRGHLELLDEDPEERAQSLALVTDELDRMARIVDDLLLLARQEEPDFLDLGTVEMETLTAELLAKARALSEHEWTLDRTGRGVVVADRQRLTQAMMQLAHNASRYSKPGAPVFVGSAIEGGEARFWVRDVGPGIAPDEHAAIFERFRRGSGARRMQGAGLGLAIVQAIAEAHHGRVELDSDVGRGSRFTVVIPVDQPLQEGGRR